MKKSILSAGLILGLCSLAGCSNISWPWEDAFLDPGRIVTREPLEIPPDLNVLPGNEPPEDVRGTPGGQTAAPSGPVPTSASQILFKTPPRQESKPLGRDEQERLPSWMPKSKENK
ncbi:MAG: hypothetical protein HQM03_08140 [Magnetococcales bacterium]|nr:hypothetical protein [Magnetococcales bacterium]